MISRTRKQDIEDNMITNRHQDFTNINHKAKDPIRNTKQKSSNSYQQLANRKLNLQSDKSNNTNNMKYKVSHENTGKMIQYLSLDDIEDDSSQWKIQSPKVTKASPEIFAKIREYDNISVPVTSSRNQILNHTNSDKPELPPLPFEIDQAKHQAIKSTVSSYTNNSNIDDDDSIEDNQNSFNQINSFQPKLRLHHIGIENINISHTESINLEPSTSSILSNEEIIPEDKKLFFSKAPRKVEYKPYTLEQYKLIKPKEYVEISNIKPDLNTDELLAKRANALRVKEFSMNLKKYNSEVLLQQQKLPSVIEQSHLEKTKSKYSSSREKALHFAKNNIPKPKTKSITTEEVENSLESQFNPIKSNVNLKVETNNQKVPKFKKLNTKSNDDIDYIDESNELKKIEDLELKHLENKKQIEAIKKSMGFK